MNWIIRQITAFIGIGNDIEKLKLRAINIRVHGSPTIVGLYLSTTGPARLRQPKDPMQKDKADDVRCSKSIYIYDHE